MVAGELLVLHQHRSLGRVIDFLLQLRRARLSGKREQLIQHLERFQIVRLGESAAAENPGQPLSDLYQDRKRIGDYEGSHGRAENDHQFRRLHQHPEAPVLHRVAGGNGTENNDDPYDW